MEKDYNPKTIEKKWQKRWAKKKTFSVKEDLKRPKYYLLEMLPYPSGHLHMGHTRNYAIGDAFARYQMMKGFNVLHPIGWDAFGMPAENAAIKNKTNPAIWTRANIKNMREQFTKLGISYDWEREVATCEPEYYKWEQQVFVRMYEKGIIARKEAMLNWCESCQTVLANEQAEGGKCWRCDNEVALKPMTQWFIRLPLYAEELLKDIDELKGWPERVRVMQREWIGKSVGASIKFLLKDTNAPTHQRTNARFIEVFTTRPDTLFGATFMSIAAENPLAVSLSKGTGHETKVKEFIERTKKIGRFDRLSGNYEKDGVFTGAYCVNPVTGWEMPVYAANFVLMDYGTGAVMAVPAHDQRDFEFAKKYDLPIKTVIKSTSHPRESGDLVNSLDPRLRGDDNSKCAYEGPGVLVNSGDFTGMDNEKAKKAIIEHLKKQGVGSETVNYKLKDWCISRQRYWGAPIPIIYCDKCGTVPVPEKDLPVKLPKEAPLTGEGGSPLAKVEKFVNCKCPKCGSKGRRETDTMDTFVESSWYFLRYCSPKYKKGSVDPVAAKYWMPVDQYIGGIEHAVGHLLYCRFWMKMMRDLDLLKFSNSNEPVKNLLTQGMVYKDGAKMSKSKRNVVSVDEMVDKYGADTARIFSLFAAPPEKDLEWNDQGVEGAYRFLNRIWRLIYNWKESSLKPRVSSLESEKIMHKTIKRVTADIERFHFNTAIAAIMEYVNALYQADISSITKDHIKSLILLISPFAPHAAEELWADLGEKGGIPAARWPEWDKALVVDDEIPIIVQVNGKLRDKLMVTANINDDEAKRLAQASDKVLPFIQNKQIKKVIYVPGKLVNIVV